MGAWIEIVNQTSKRTNHLRRTPRWVRGLKSFCHFVMSPLSLLSHPTMGAWIEIIDTNDSRNIVQSRTPRWVRGLKFLCK